MMSRNQIINGTMQCVSVVVALAVGTALVLLAGSYVMAAAATAATPAAALPVPTTWRTVAVTVYYGLGGHTFAISVDGSLWCWGKNAFGQLGVGDTLDRRIPTRVGARVRWRSVAGGYGFTCAVRTDDILLYSGPITSRNWVSTPGWHLAATPRGEG